ncbi:MAG: hypothetical protein KAH18_06235 [Psychromonas sp.]|nr:hypothetical protein [Psychromonas sp.]
MINTGVKLDKQSIETSYQKLWNVEVFHKNIKLSTARANSPAQTKNTQGHPIFMSLIVTVKLECLNI